MFSELNPFLKIALAIFWAIYLPMLAVAVIATKELTLADAFLRLLIPLAVYFIWFTKLHQHLFFGLFGEPGTSFVPLIKSYIFSFISSFVYLFILLLLVLLINFSSTLNTIPLLNWLITLCTASFISALLLFQRFRIIEDTPLTTLNSAAQGYSELEGTATLYEGETGRSPHKDFPVMVWYRRFFYVSAQGFLLDDETGKCTIDPRDAEVITPFNFYNGLIYNAIYPNEKIYVLGQLFTLNKHRTEWEQKGLINSRLRKWKSNKFAFLDMFDRNRDGVIDHSELHNAKLSAERVISDELETKYQEPATHIISRPDDGRPFILSSIHPDNLVKRYKIAMIVHSLLSLFMIITTLVMT